MEFIIELVLELFLDGSMEAVRDKKLPKWGRILALGLLTVFYIAFVVLLIVLSVQSGSPLMRAITGLIALAFFIIFIWFWVKLLRQSNKK